MITLPYTAILDTYKFQVGILKKKDIHTYVCMVVRIYVFIIRMYVCVCIYMYIHMHTHTHKHTHTCIINIYVHTHKHTHTCIINIYVYMYICIYACIYNMLTDLFLESTSMLCSSPAPSDYGVNGRRARIQSMQGSTSCAIYFS